MKKKDWLIRDVPIPVYESIKRRCQDLSCTIPKLFELEFGFELEVSGDSAWTIKCIDNATINRIQAKAKEHRMSVGRYLQYLMQRNEDICNLEQKKVEYKERLLKEVIDKIKGFE